MCSYNRPLKLIQRNTSDFLYYKLNEYCWEKCCVIVTYGDVKIIWDFMQHYRMFALQEFMLRLNPTDVCCDPS